MINSKVFPDGDPDDDGDQDMPKGSHGYDPDYVDEMSAIMYAYGPDIRDGQVIEQMDQVDHYNLFCALLNLEPKPNNGTTEMFKQVLNKYATEEEDQNDGEKENEDDKENKKKKKDGDDDDEDDDENDDDEDEDNGTIALSASRWLSALFAIALCVMLQL